MKEFLFGKTNWRALQLVLLGVLGSLVVLALIPVSSHSHERDPILRSSRQVRSLAQGAITYASLHNDIFPSQEQWPNALIDLGILETEMLTSTAEDGDGVSFIYVPGCLIFEATQILVYEDPKHWEEGVIVGFADAHVEIVPLDVFEKMIAEQLKARSAEP